MIPSPAAVRSCGEAVAVAVTVTVAGVGAVTDTDTVEGVGAGTGAGASAASALASCTAAPSSMVRCIASLTCRLPAFDAPTSCTARITSCDTAGTNPS